jgi:hypothetical protein
MSKPFLYIFVDEGGNFDFSPTGTRFFTLTALTCARPFSWEERLSALKYDLLEEGTPHEYFHATEDLQSTRNRVFGIIAETIDSIRIDSIVAEKAKTIPAWQTEERFYPEMLCYLLRYIVRREPLSDFAGVIAMTDAIPIRKKRQALEKAVKETLAQRLPQGSIYQALHHDSKSCMGLQMVDYCNWAIYRKWDKGDSRSYEHIRRAIRSEFDIFRRGTQTYY